VVEDHRSACTHTFTMKVSITVVLCLLFIHARAFAPLQVVPCNGRTKQHASLVVLEMAAEKKTKRKAALQTLTKVVGAVGTLAIATASPARAAKTVVETAINGSRAKYSVASLTVAVITGFMAKITISAGEEVHASGRVAEKIKEFFPGAITNKSLVQKVSKALKKYNYGKDSLVATSLCPDEVNRCLEAEFVKLYGDTFNMGGLSGFPFGGSTAFGNMASHIPQGESALIVFAPHVGVDGEGNIGTVDRRGRKNGGPCCDSAIAASEYVLSVHKGIAKAKDIPAELLDAQQSFVGSMLLPHAGRLDASTDIMVELPYALYDSQKELMTDIVSTAAGAVSGDGKIAVLGGIQVNTPLGIHDYFLPLSLEVYDNTGRKVDDLTL